MERFLQVAPNMVRCTYTGEKFPVDTTTVTNGEFLQGEILGNCPITVKSVTFQGRDIYLNRPDGKPEIKIVKTVDGQRSYVSNLVEIFDRRAYRAAVELEFDQDEAIFGLGQDEDGVLNRRGTVEYLYQHNMKIPMPMFVSSKGYGVLFDCACLMVFDDTKDICSITLECVEQVDFYVVTGSLDEIVGGFRQLTGTATKMPPWVFGYWQSKEKYTTQQELVDVVSQYREFGVPIDVLVQDWKTWVGELWGDKHLDLERYPNVKEANDQIHDMNAHTIVSVWPNMNAGGKDHQEFADQNMLLGDYSTYDAFSEEARAIYWKQAESELFRGGFDGWWCDSTEPFCSPDWGGETKLGDEARYQMVGAEHEKYLDPAVANCYAMEHAKGIFENQPSKPVVNLTRSGWAGIQKYGTILWAGDTSATWTELRQEIAKGLSVSYCGLPYWTVDGGAFFTGGLECWRRWSGNPDAKPVWFWEGDYEDGVADLGYQELYTRWMQFACFLPVFRSHGTDTPREIWNFGEPFRSAIEDTIRLRYDLMPYILDMAEQVADSHFTMMRSLAFDFPEDKKAWTIDDQFLFGKDILVCPVLEPMLYNAGSKPVEHRPKTKACYLPAGTDWVDFWMKTTYPGGETVEIPLKLYQIPLFVRRGASIPMSQGRMFALDDKPVEQVSF